MKVSVSKSELVSALKLVSKAKEKNIATPIGDPEKEWEELKKRSQKHGR